MAGRKTLIRAAVILAVFVGFAAYFRWTFEQRRTGTTVAPAEMYATLIATPVPPGVSALEGTGATWQGYSIYLRFQVASLEAAGLTTPPYESIDCNKVESFLQLPEHFRPAFSPAWSIPTGPGRSCLVAYEVSNEWTHLGTHRVMFSDGRAWFVGIGS
jgi:hypothetical protein